MQEYIIREDFQKGQKIENFDEIEIFSENETSKISSWRNETLGQKNNLRRHHRVTEKIGLEIILNLDDFIRKVFQI